MLEGVLQHAGHKTLSADTGEKALDILVEKIDIIDIRALNFSFLVLPVAGGESDVFTASPAATG